MTLCVCFVWVGFFFGSQLLFRDLEIMHHLQLSPTDYDLVAIDAEFWKLYVLLSLGIHEAWCWFKTSNVYTEL